MRFRTGVIGYDRADTKAYFRLLAFEGQWLQAKIREQERIHSAELMGMVNEIEALRSELRELDQNIMRLSGNRNAT